MTESFLTFLSVAMIIANDDSSQINYPMVSKYNDIILIDEHFFASVDF